MTDSVLVPDGITPVVGWRAYKTSNGKLRSATRQILWEPRVAHRAVCNRSNSGLTSSLLFAYSMFSVAAPSMPSDPSAHEVGAKTEYDQLTGEHFTMSDKVKIVSTRRAIPQKVGAPLDSCSCGIYAAQSVDKVMDYIKEGGMVGRIALWGKVIVYTDGWRGEYGYPQALYVKTSDDYKIAQQYGVPVLKWTDLPAIDRGDAMLREVRDAQFQPLEKYSRNWFTR